MQGTLFPEPDLEEINSLTNEQYSALENLIENKGDEALLFDTPEFNPRNPYLKNRLCKYLRCNISNNHYLLIRYNQDTIGFAVVLGCQNRNKAQPVAPSTLFAIVDPQYYVWKNEIMRKLDALKEYYGKAGK